MIEQLPELQQDQSQNTLDSMNFHILLSCTLKQRSNTHCLEAASQNNSSGLDIRRILKQSYSQTRQQHNEESVQFLWLASPKRYESLCNSLNCICTIDSTIGVIRYLTQE